jgi:hypothetical protein
MFAFEDTVSKPAKALGFGSEHPRGLSFGLRVRSDLCTRATAVESSGGGCGYDRENITQGRELWRKMEAV